MPNEKNNLLQEIERLQQENRRMVEEKDVADERFRQQTSMFDTSLDFVKSQNKELESSLADLKMSKSELENFAEELKSLLSTVEDQKSKIEHKTEELKASINYAKHIQASILPSPERMAKYFHDASLLFLPKDTVSGDFYWVDELQNGKIVIITGDCTGHGVPGAIMGAIVNSIINQTVNNQQLDTPAEIILAIHTLLLKTFQKNNAHNRDGLDISVSVIDNKEKKMYFSATMQELVYIQAGELHECKGNYFHLGREIERESKEINTTTIDLSIPTTFYMFSDGYSDQFGGEYDTKFMSKKLKKLLHEISQKEILTQQQILYQTLKSWQGKEEQTDDILVFACRV